MLMITCLGLILHWILPVTSAKIIIHPNEVNPLAETIQLDMAENSVDDMYFNCSEKMTDKVQTIFEKEMKDRAFQQVWMDAQTCVKRKRNASQILTKDQIQAICVYTAGGRDDFYKTFNKDVRTGASTYRTSFHYHALHFWLTSAVQILNQQRCYQSFRRTKQVFYKVNKVVRFGFFASSSRLDNLETFGEDTCFCIYTCYGAYLETYPRLRDEEQEVLIPPYEVFKKTKDRCTMNCKKNYSLKSIGIMSHQNCKVVRP